jgi:arginyl-tRNA synthetase
MKDTIENVLKETLGDLIASRELGPDAMPPVIVTIPRDKAHGDFSTNAAMIMSKKAGCNPREIAAELCERLNQVLADHAACTVAGPGFINFTLSDDAGKAIFDRLLGEGESIGSSDEGTGQTVNIEYVSANPTGPLSVGHGRNAAVGDVIANLLAAAGYTVTREYYFNDAGNQMAVLARSVRTRYRQLAGVEEELEEGGYQGQYIVEIARRILEERGDSLVKTDDLALFKQYAVEATFSMIKSSLKSMRVHHDVYFNEYSLYDSGKIEETLKRISDKDLSYEKDGAVWYRAKQFGAEKDRALVKSSGEPTYRLPDIAYHIDKFSRGYDRIIDVFGADHIAQYPDVLSCLQALGYDIEKVTVVVYQFVTIVRDGQAVKMSTRKANYITLDDLMEEVGVDATRYFFVMRRLGSHLEFDLELAKSQSLDNPVFYVQYAHARICSIFRHAAEQKPGIDIAALAHGNVDSGLLVEPEEQDLIRHLSQFAELIRTAARACEPHRLTGYLEKLAELFHRYYNQHQVVVDNDEVAGARLALTLVTQRVLRKGLAILGVSAPEQM